MSKISWFEPQPRQKPKRLPRRRPIKVVPSAIGDEGIVGNWLFYYLKGGDHLHDFSPKDNHGTINGAKWVDGRYGWALGFDGEDDYVSIPDDPSFDALTSDLTVVAWVQPMETGRFAPVSKYFSSSWGIDYLSPGIDFRYGREDGTIVEAYAGAFEVTTGTWYHFAGVAENGRYARVYVNGKLKTSDDAGSSGTIKTNNLSVSIGRRADGQDYLNGKIDMVRIYNRPLSGSKIKRIYGRTKGIFGL